MTLYLLMTALVLIAGAWLTRPWWRRAQAAPPGRRAVNVVAYRSRLAEIDADIAAELIDEATAAQLRQELGAHLVADAPAGESQGVGEARAPSYRAAVAAILLLAAFGAVAYWFQGSWRTSALIDTARSNPDKAGGMSIEAMVHKLETRLAKQPGDTDGWAMLGRSYAVLERYADATQAYAKANELTGSQQPDLLVGEGEVLALSRDRDLLGRPQRLFAQALSLEPDHAKALWYAGLAAAQAEDFGAAREHWARLAKRDDLPPELREALDARLQELAKLAGETVAVAPGTTPLKEPPAQGGVSLHVTVQLAASLAGKTVPGQTLFVFAKAEQGPPMPLAVLRIEHPKLPLQLVLDDSMAMLPQMKLSAFERYVVTARLGHGTDVRAQPGDWEGSVTLGRAEAGKPLTIQIDRVVP
ncbi:MAG TPA: c-type cytochrome biogenesis protein CcmI [Solimonas sp.]|nr:c-type cytochrome biogenesis protein CcmI [Solimonas sp.]